jgi:hypothetical protein
MMEDLFSREWQDFLGREHGPLHFRLIVQPVVASVLAVRAGWRDSREGGPAFFWAVVGDPAHRLYLLRQGWKDVGKVFLLALALDVIYQLLALRWVYPGQALTFAALLALVPYLVLRGPVNRIAARTSPRQSPDGKESVRPAQEIGVKSIPSSGGRQP